MREIPRNDLDRIQNENREKITKSEDESDGRKRLDRI